MVSLLTLHSVRLNNLCLMQVYPRLLLRLPQNAHQIIFYVGIFSVTLQKSLHNSTSTIAITRQLMEELPLKTCGFNENTRFFFNQIFRNAVVAFHSRLFSWARTF